MATDPTSTPPPSTATTTTSTTTATASIPSIYRIPFRQLPTPKRVWPAPAGSRAEGVGRLSILTAEVVAAAAAGQIRCGRRVGLGWDMRKLEYSQFGRQRAEHRVVPLVGPGMDEKRDGKEVWGTCFDDVYTFNPQQSSQWDGFRHYSQPRNLDDPSSSMDRVFFGGTTKHEIGDAQNHRIGIQSWATEGIAGRGILLDYALYSSLNNIKYSNFSMHNIPLDVLKSLLKFHDITPEFGDILFIRMGVMPEWDSFDDAKKQEYATQKVPQHAGVEASIETLEWVWNSGFSAVAGDMISWEVFPTPGAVSMHEYLLAGWGCPIGELFDLELLSKTCQELGRWTFFLTSMPLNMPGGVSSPPNAMAIF